ncbi:non-functional NADPH-dependent codeinone reductase 2-like [Heracleum sosnowskyi]|uniref:Non-functional NADPH-dependent codeinone reductase 2-like n=1 Tax=Heracleum sosnowskyi TaxID=360622 RepID=A0AAD8MQN5_9APIA|nr:non-functional NADPH-dependent codeinone reductase 2-like [Heracleum sosnowskyi]
MEIPTVKLHSTSGHLIMPVIGMGTTVDRWKYDPAAIKEALVEAVKAGYRHFDTAALYMSEPYLGEALAEALKLGIVSRNELFITTKLWAASAHPGHVIPALKKSLQNLQLEYVDLYLIHWPISIKPGKYVFPVNKEDLLPLDFKSVWADMEECQRLGLTKSIGVCNFSCKKIENLLSHATIPPAINQVEMSPVWQQKKLRDLCSANNITVTAYSPLGAAGNYWGTNQVMNCQVLHEIAKDRGKTVAQVILRWVYEQGVTLLVKSFNTKRMKENLEIFNWALLEDDYEKINAIQQSRGMPKYEFISENGPFKSADELWDGEM